MLGRPIAKKNAQPETSERNKQSKSEAHTATKLVDGVGGGKKTNKEILKQNNKTKTMVKLVDLSPHASVTDSELVGTEKNMEEPKEQKRT